MNRVEKYIYILIWMIFLFLFRSRRKSDRVWGGPVGTYPAAGYGVWSGWLQQVVGVAAPSGGQRLPSDSTRRPSTHPPSCGGSREFLERGREGDSRIWILFRFLSREREAFEVKVEGDRALLKRIISSFFFVILQKSVCEWDFWEGNTNYYILIVIIIARNISLRNNSIYLHSPPSLHRTSILLSFEESSG